MRKKKIKKENKIGFALLCFVFSRVCTRYLYLIDSRFFFSVFTLFTCLLTSYHFINNAINFLCIEYFVNLQSCTFLLNWLSKTNLTRILLSKMILPRKLFHKWLLISMCSSHLICKVKPLNLIPNKRSKTSRCMVSRSNAGLNIKKVQVNRVVNWEVHLLWNIARSRWKLND